MIICLVIHVNFCSFYAIARNKIHLEREKNDIHYRLPHAEALCYINGIVSLHFGMIICIIVIVGN